MPEDVVKKFSFPNFTSPMPGTLSKVLDKGMALRYKISLNGLGVQIGEPLSVSMITRTGMEVAEYFTHHFKIWTLKTTEMHKFQRYNNSVKARS